MIYKVNQAVVLAGGEGTRLRPLTNHRPKPLLPVLGRPCVEYTLRALAGAGIEKVYLACGYKSMDVVKALGDGKGLGLDLVYAFEEQPMGTAGAVKLLEDQLDETFVVAMGDTLMDIDFEVVVREHEEKKAVVTIALTEVDKPTEFGIVGLGDDQRIMRFKEKPKQEEVFSNLINAGVYVIQREAFDFVPEDTKFDFSKNLFPKLMEAGKPLYGSLLRGLWKDIGRPQDLLDANIRMAERKGVERFISGIKTEGRIYGGGFSGQGAVLNGPLYVGDGVKIGEGTVVTRSAIGQGTVIEPVTRILDSLILDSCLIQRGACLEGTIVGDGCRVGAGVVLKGCILGDQVVIEGPANLEGQTIE
jgi:mannose-1-phosphate guanylyltransferase